MGSVRYCKVVKYRIVRGVAQMARALAWGVRGRWFESSRPDILISMNSKNGVCRVVDHSGGGL